MSFGVMGGNLQPQGHIQTLIRMLDYKQNPHAACDGPRWRVAGGMKINSEYTMRPDTLKALQDRGRDIATLNAPYLNFGSVQFAWWLEEEGPAGTQLSGYIAASDARKDGHAAGV